MRAYKIENKRKETKKEMETLISPSLLSANFIDLRSDIDMINRSEADWLHLDIMDAKPSDLPMGRMKDG